FQQFHELSVHFTSLHPFTQVDSVPRDIGRSWEDPMAKPGERHLAAELKNVGMSSIDHMPTWKKDQLSMLEERSVLWKFLHVPQLNSIHHCRQERDVRQSDEAVAEGATRVAAHLQAQRS